MLRENTHCQTRRQSVCIIAKVRSAVTKIIEANPQISNPNVLALGEKVKIPTAPVSVPDNSEVYYKHTVKQGDTLWKLSKAWGIPLKDMVEANPS